MNLLEQLEELTLKQREKVAEMNRHLIVADSLAEEVDYIEEQIGELEEEIRWEASQVEVAPTDDDESFSSW